MDNTLLATIILGSVGILVTLYYSWQSKKLAHEQMQKQLFTEFNQRYNVLNDYLIEIELHYPTLELLKKTNNCTVEQQKVDMLKRKVIDYFSLCAEEFYWFHHKKRIEPLIWNSWQSGMNYWYKNVPSIKGLWEAELRLNSKESYYITNEVEFFKS